MNVSELMTDALGRISDLVHGAVDGLSDDDLAWRPDPEANSIAWLVWHLTRIEDDHVAGVARTTQAWEDGWADRFGLPFPVGDHGYGHTSAQVGQVRARADLLAGSRRAPPPISPGSSPTTSTAWSTNSGIRRSRWACAW